MLEWALGERPRIAINAFSMGAWATGVNMGEALELCGVVKSTGPDLDKILHTLEFFGPRWGYLLCGYPPFMKRVLDGMRQRGFPIADYEMHALVGGEGMTEELRRYLLGGFRSCYSGYGASDLELGIALETPEAVRVRGLLNDRAEVRREILEGDHRVPMVFQYNPLTHFLETNERDELLVTLNHSRVLSPRIRYNIGDEAKLMTRRDILERLRRLGHDVTAADGRGVSLPYLILFGRRDQTISIMGANIYAEDVERVVYAQPELARGFASFMLTVAEREDRSVFPRLFIEMARRASARTAAAGPGRPDPAVPGRDQRRLPPVADRGRGRPALRRGRFRLGSGTVRRGRAAHQEPLPREGCPVRRPLRGPVAVVILTATSGCALFGGQRESLTPQALGFEHFHNRDFGSPHQTGVPYALALAAIERYPELLGGDRQRFCEKFGIGFRPDRPDSLPSGFALRRDGITGIDFAMTNCSFCHSGQIGGHIVPGLGSRELRLNALNLSDRRCGLAR
jgi:hypothetical protein